MNKVVSLKLTKRNMVIMNKKIFKRHRRDSDKKQGNLRRQRRYVDKISDDLKFSILSYLPPKSLLKFRCVSKEFRRIIDDPLFALEHSRRLEANKIPFTGFFIANRGHFFTRGLQTLSFMSTNNTDAGGGLPDSSLSFLKEDQLKDVVKLVDSCNGLLLCKTKNSSKYEEKLFVCNPLTMQIVFIPHPSTHGWTRTYGKHFALIAKSTSMGYLRYKVVHIYYIITKEDKEYSKLKIFSSETGEWEAFHYRLPILCDFMDERSRIFVKDTTLIWDCFESGKYILVCYLNSKSSPESSSFRCFEVIESPCQYEYVRCLWDYNGKILFYATDSYNKHNGKLSAWSLCFGDNDKIEWKNENTLQLETLAEDIWKCGYSRGRELLPADIQIVGYNPSLKTMYVLIERSVLLSYELVQRKFELVEKFKRGYYERNVAFQYIHSLEPIEIGRTKTDISTTVDDDDDDPILCDDD